MKVVLDTNVLVSALLNPHGKPSHILRLIISEQIDFLVDDRIIYEYRDVLQRAEFGFDPNHIDNLLAYLDAIGNYTSSTPLPFNIPDMGDAPFLEIAISGNADTLITGNKKDYGNPPKGLKILNPSEFLDYYSRLC